MPFYDKESVLNALRGRFADFYVQHGAELKPDGREMRGPCPLHQGSGPNFTVDPETGQWFCHSQCQTGGDVFTFVEEVAGLDFPQALALVAEWAGVREETRPQPSPKPPAPRNSVRPRVVATYDYTDEQGKLLFQVQRWEPGKNGEAKDFRQRRPDGRGGWIYDLKGVRRVPYGLPEVVAAVAAGRPVYICEGEKAADALRALGVTAACNPGGSGNWPAELNEAFCGAGLVILPDNDDPGRRHAQKVAALLHGTARRVRVVALPNLPPKGDAVEWIAAGRTLDQLNALVKQAPDWTPEPPPAPSVTALPPPSNTMRRKSIAERIVDLADVEPPGDLPLMFGQYLLKGASHWLTGQTGLGKSTFMYNVAAALAEGVGLWDIPCEPQRVLYLDMESGDVGRALKVERLYLDSPRVRGRLLFAREPIRLPEELPDLTAFAKEQGITLVIFDTARRCFTVKDENDNAEVYNRIVPTLDALKQIGVATLTMGHPPKNGALGARGAGAQEDAGDVNLTLTMLKGEVNDPNGVIVLKVTKNRLLGLNVPPLYLRRAGNDRFERIDAEEANSGIGNAKRPGRQDQCKADLTEFLAARPQNHASFKEIIDAMSAIGHSESTAKRTHKEMRDDGDLTRAVGGGWILADPFE